MTCSAIRATLTCLLLALAGTLSPLGAQGGRARTTTAITVADLRTRLFLIADDSMMGRETGSKGDFQTAEYVASEFKRLGLKPAGENGDWFQTVPFWIGSPVATTLTIDNGPTLHWGIDYTLPGFAGVPTSGPVAVIYGGTENDPASWITVQQSAGKLVVLDLRPDSAGNRNLPPLLPILRAAQFAHAVGLAVVRLDGLTPGAVANGMRFTPRPDTSRIAGTPALLSISTRTADLLLGASVSTLQAGAPGRIVRGDMTLKYAPVKYPARNVIGILPGRDPALRGEYVSVTGHNDHVGICMSAVDHDSMRAFLHVLRPMGADTRTWNETPEADREINRMIDSMRKLRPARADSICNGADDDGTGTVAILELAESFAGMPMARRPRRSILFVSHVGEERGLVGSAWYTDHATVPIDSIVAEIDEDMIGRGTAWDLPKGGPGYLEVVGARRLSNEFGDLLEAANATQRVPFVFNYEFDVPGHPLQYYCRADHYSYARYGIPSVAFSRGEHLDYHQVTDEAQYVDYPDMLRVINMVHDAVLRIANLDHAPKLDHPRGDPHAVCRQ
ncbi:MAG: M28 family metallopeptidase [Gemmatimonadales bacterium]